MPGTVKSRSFQMLSVTNVTIVIEKILLDKSHFITGTCVNFTQVPGTYVMFGLKGKKPHDIILSVVL